MSLPLPDELTLMIIQTLLGDTLTLSRLSLCSRTLHRIVSSTLYSVLRQTSQYALPYYLRTILSTPHLALHLRHIDITPSPGYLSPDQIPTCIVIPPSRSQRASVAFWREQLGKVKTDNGKRIIKEFKDSGVMRYDWHSAVALLLAHTREQLVSVTVRGHTEGYAYGPPIRWAMGDAHLAEPEWGVMLHRYPVKCLRLKGRRASDSGLDSGLGSGREVLDFQSPPETLRILSHCREFEAYYFRIRDEGPPVAIGMQVQTRPLTFTSVTLVDCEVQTSAWRRLTHLRRLWLGGNVEYNVMKIVRALRGVAAEVLEDVVIRQPGWMRTRIDAPLGSLVDFKVLRLLDIDSRSLLGRWSREDMKFSHNNTNTCTSSSNDSIAESSAPPPSPYNLASTLLPSLKHLIIRQCSIFTNITMQHMDSLFPAPFDKTKVSHRLESVELHFVGPILVNQIDEVEGTSRALGYGVKLVMEFEEVGDEVD